MSFLLKSLVWNLSIQMPATIARIALSQHNWDKDLLLEKCYDDPEKFFEKINVLNPFQTVATTSTESTSGSTGECLTCFEEFPLSVSRCVVALDTQNKHIYCNMLWNTFFSC